MSRSPKWASRLLSALLPAQDAEFVLGDIEERFHDHVAGERSPGAARRWYWRQAVVSITLCWATRARDSWRPIDGRRDAERWWQSWVQDLRFSVRSFARHPRFTAIAAITLTLGLGANIGIFSVVNGILLRPLAFPDAQELMVLWTLDPQSGDTYNVSGPNASDVGQLDAFEGLYLFSRDEVILTRESGTRERILAARVTAEVFDVLGVAPLIGHGFTPEQDRPGSAVAILAFSLWQSRFGGDPDILERTLELDGVTHRIAGVAPPSFRLPMAPDEELWLPFAEDPVATPRDQVWLGAVGRLRDGVDPRQARQQVAALWNGLQEEFPVQTVDIELTLIELQRDLTATVRPGLLVLLGATAFLMLMACANVTSLLLTRASQRRGELALRSALGAGRGRIIRQMLTENALLALTAAALGILFALAVERFVRALAPPSIPRLQEITVDGAVVAFAVVMALVMTVLSGLVPALAAAGRNVRSALGEGRRIAGDRRGRLTRRALVVCQVAVAMMLMVGAGLLVRSFLELVDVDPGYEIDGVLQASVLLPPEIYTEPEQRAELFSLLESRASALPGVVSAGTTLAPPLDENHINYTLRVEGHEQPPPGQDPVADVGIASRGYFETLRIPLRRGRHFADSDLYGGPRVVVVSQLLVEQLWPDGSDPIGQRLSLISGEWSDQPRWREIVGVVDNVRQQTLESDEQPYLYLPISQSPQQIGTLLVRTSGPPEQLAAPIRELLAEIEPRMPVPEIATMDVRLRRSLAARSFFTLLLGAFAGLALVLASIGLYGVLAFAVDQRRGEIGVRMTFGAERGQIVAMVLGEGLRVVALGVVLGGLGALALSRLLATMVFGIETTDPLTFGCIAAVLLATAVLACAVPALRAATVNPSIALHRR